MKAILEFNLPEDEDYFEVARYAYSYRHALSEFSLWLREQRKYTDMTEDQNRYFRKIEDKFWELMGEEGLDHLF